MQLRLIVHALAAQDVGDVLVDPGLPGLRLLGPGEVEKVRPLPSRRQRFESRLQARHFSESLLQLVGDGRRPSSVTARELWDSMVRGIAIMALDGKEVATWCRSVPSLTGSRATLPAGLI